MSQRLFTTYEFCSLMIALGKKIIRMFYYQQIKILSMLKSKADDQVSTRESQNFSNENGTIIASNKLCGIIWDDRGKLNWFLGYVLKINENSINI